MRSLALVLALLVGAVAPARGDEKGEREARALFKEANRFLDEGNYVDALEMYESAYAKFPSPKILLNIGTAQRQVGRYAEAADTYERYLADPGTDPARRPEVEKMVADLGRLVARLRLAPSEADARLLVDGKSVTTAVLRVNAGTHAVVAERAGFQTLAVTVVVKAGEERTVALALTRLAATATAPASVPAVAVIGGEGHGAAGTAETGIVRRAAPPGRLALLVRGDLDPVHVGSVWAVGVGLLVRPGVDLRAAALVGPVFGAYLGGRLRLGRGALAPTVSVGVPVLFTDDDGVQVGLHAAVGAELAIGARIALFVDVGAQLFPGAGAANAAFLFVPSIGALARL